jgi:two-component system, cell cycle response regulator DivK
VRTILVIEDNPLHEKLFLELLRHYGYRVLVAREGEEGLSIARREQPDLMIIDCYLPSQGALQTLRLACGDKVLYPMPVIATSAFADESECKALEALGCAAYVPKPVSVGSLIATVKRVLNEPAPSRHPVEMRALAQRPTA